jgi:hypothetical protein
MSNYNVKVIDSTVHHWSKKDGQGDYVCNKSGFDLARVSELSEAKDAINDFIGYDLDDHNYQDEYISASIIEDEEGRHCVDGEYIVDYCFVIEEAKLVTFHGKL